MTKLQEYKCPNCGGAIIFDSKTQKMKCPYCDSDFEMSELAYADVGLEKAPEERMVWDPEAGCEWNDGESDGLSSYVCNSCGGEIVADATTAATSCPYCDNPVVMKGKLTGVLKPDCIIPFRYDKKAAKEALKKHYENKKLLPKVFRDKNHIDEVKGIYVPFWLYNTDASADMEYDAQRRRRWSDSSYDYEEVSHYRLLRGGHISFISVPVDGSSKMADILMESIEPFDVSEAVEFSTAYLAGYYADRYDVDAKESVNRANERIRESVGDEFAVTTKNFEYVDVRNSYIRLDNATAKYALYPVWILNTTWKGEKYTFAMNGQTGKFVGDLPLDKAEYKKWLFGITGAVAAVCFVFSYLMWLL